MMLAGLQQRRGRLLTAYLDAHMVVGPDLLDFGITRAASHGTGAEIGLLSKVLAPFQDSLASIAQSIMGRPTTRGQLPGTIQDNVALKVAVALPGSLHLRLVPVVPESQQALFEGDYSLLEVSLESLCGLVQAGNSSDDTLSHIASAGPRAASHLHTLSKVLAENHANLDLRWRSPRTSLDARLDSQRAAELRQVLEDVTDEIRERVFRGRIAGANLIRKTFDLQLGESDEDGTVISGRVPSLPMSCETLMIKELLTLEGENGARHDVGDRARRSRWSRSGGSRRRPERRGRRARRAGGGPRPRAGRAGSAAAVHG